MARNHRPHHLQGSYSNNEIIFQDIPGWIEQNFQDFSDMVYHTSVAIKLCSQLFILAFSVATEHLVHILKKINEIINFFK